MQIGKRAWILPVTALGACLTFGGQATAQQVTSYVYDALGRVVRVTHPNQTATTYAYDAADNRTNVATSTGAAGTPTANNDLIAAYPVDASPYFVVTAFAHIDPLWNDTDPNGAPLSIASWTGGSSGIVDGSDGQTFAYLSNPTTYSGDTFTYTVTNGHNASPSATINVLRFPQEATPYAYNDIVHAYPINIPGFIVSAAFINFNPIAGFDPIALSGDYDYAGRPLTITSVTNGSNGLTVVTSPTTVAYLSDGSGPNPDSFQYTISNGAGGTKTATIYVYRHP